MRPRYLALLPVILAAVCLSLILLSCSVTTSSDQSGSPATVAQGDTGGAAGPGDTGTSTDGQGGLGGQGGTIPNSGGMPSNPHGFGRSTITPPGHQNIPTVDDMKQDLIASRSFIVDAQADEWNFDSLPEFVDFTIVGQNQSGDQLSFTVNMQLQDTNTKQFFNARATITYKQDGGLWVFSGINGTLESAGQEI